MIVKSAAAVARSRPLSVLPKTTEPQPKKTSTKVPITSAATFWTVVDKSAMSAC